MRNEPRVKLIDGQQEIALDTKLSIRLIRESRKLHKLGIG